jgi:disulfide bond formation protein DsbB
MTPPSLRLFMRLILLGSVAVIGGAWLFQLVGGLAPCELCLYERWPDYAAIPVAAALCLPRATRRVGGRLGAAVLLILFIASSALAFYHVGVEQHWFAGPTACTGGGGPAPRSIEELQKQLLGQQPVQCDQPQWSLFGVTLAGANLLASLVLAALSLVALRRAAGRRA